MRKRSVVYDINKNIPEKLLESDAEWLLIDARVLTYGISKIIFNDDDYEYITNFELKSKQDIFKSLFNDKYTIEPVKINNEELSQLQKDFVNFVKKRYGDRIILLEVLETEYYFDENGNLHDRGTAEKTIFEEYSYTYQLLSTLKCHYIRCPTNIVGDSLHMWGLNRVHYLSEYYEYAYHSIKAIINQNNKTELTQILDELYVNTAMKISGIRSNEILSANNTIKRSIKYAENGNSSSARELLDILIKEKCPKAYYQYGIFYKNGLFNDSNYKNTINYLSLSASMGFEPAITELFDTLHEINTAECNMKAYILVSSHAHSGNVEVLTRLSKCYSDGIGTKIDYDKSIEIMKDIVNVNWQYTNNLCEILAKRGSKEDLKEIFDRSLYISNEKLNKDAMLNVARCYRDGIGTTIDTENAISWMRKAYNRGSVIAGNELFDLLWKKDTIESSNEMITIALKQARNGNGGAIARIGRAYRFGKGVEKDTNESIIWYKSAIEKGVLWANNELFDIYWELNTPEYDIEMFKLIEYSAKNGNPGSMGRLGRAYRDGRGVKKNLDLAREWLKKSGDKGIKWANREYHEIT